jgi:hypothetical protein
MAASPRSRTPTDVKEIIEKLDIRTPESEIVVAARIADESKKIDHQHTIELIDVRRREKWDYFVMGLFVVAGAFCCSVIYNTRPPDDSSRSAFTILAGIVSAAAAYTAGRNAK